MITPPIASVQASTSNTEMLPTRIMDMPQGSPMLRRSYPHTARMLCSRMMSRPQVVMITAKVGRAAMRRITTRSIAIATSAVTMIASAMAKKNGRPTLRN